MYFPSLLLLPTALALPLFGFGDSDTDASASSAGAPSPVSATTINGTLQRPALFARVAYCSSDSITSWTCGAPCDAVKGVTFLQKGGDEGAIPLYYIAHSEEDDALVVAHEGTDPAKFLSILNDAQFGLVPLNASRFPGTDDSVKVHDGFQQTFERTADGLLAGVVSGLAATKASKILVTGHSLGAALASMTGAFLKLNLASSSPDVDVSVVGFGLPRGGNDAYASFLESTFPDGAHAYVTNQDDPVPLVPPEFLGFAHPAGEVHVIDGETNELVSCVGRDSEACSTGNNLLASSIPNHLGPYFNEISFGGPECS